MFERTVTFLHLRKLLSTLVRLEKNHCSSTLNIVPVAISSVVSTGTAFVYAYFNNGGFVVEHFSV